MLPSNYGGGSREKDSKDYRASWCCTKNDIKRNIFQRKSVHMPLFNAIDENASASQRAKFTEKVHKPPLGVNVISFELNGCNVSIWSLGVPQTPKMI